MKIIRYFNFFHIKILFITFKKIKNLKKKANQINGAVIII